MRIKSIQQRQFFTAFLALILLLVLVLLIVCNPQSIPGFSPNPALSSHNSQPQQQRSLQSQSVRQRYCADIDYTKTGSSSDDRDSTRKLIDSQVLKNKNYVLSYLNSNETTDSESHLQIEMGLHYMLPYFVLFIMAIFCWFGYIFYFVCAPRCCCLRPKDYSIKFSRFELAWPAIGLFFISTVVIVAGAVGIYYDDFLKSGYKRAQCVGVAVLDDVNQGVTGWAGLNQITYRLDNFNASLALFLQRVNYTFSVNNQPWAGDYIKAQTAFVKDTVDGSTSTSVTSNNLRQYEYNLIESPKISASSSVKSAFFQKSWYPYNKDGQMTNALYSLNTGAGTALARILDELQLSGLAISQSSYQFNKSISEGQVQIRQIRQKVQDLITRFSSSLDNVSEIVSDLQLWLFIFFLIALVFAAAVSVSMIMIMLKKFGAFLWFVHFGWLLFGFLAIVGFAGCMLLSPINAVVVQSCQVLHGFLNDPVTFQKGFARYPDIQSVTEKFFVCRRAFQLNNNNNTQQQQKNILEQFSNISVQVNQVLDLANKIASVQAIKSNPLYTEFAKSKTLVSDYVKQMEQQIQTGLNDHEDSEYAFSNLNDFTLYFNGSFQERKCGESYVNDTWLFNSTIKPFKCSNENLTAGGDLPESDGNTTNKNSGNFSLCLNVNKFNLNNIINKRYNISNIKGSSPNKPFWLNSVIEQMNQIQAFVNRKRDIFQNKTNHIQQYNTKHQDFYGLIDNYLLNISSFLQNTKATMDKITDKSQGVSANLDCLALGDNFDLLYDSVCVNYSPTIFANMNLLVIESVAMLFACLFYFCVANRYRDDKDFISESQQIINKKEEKYQEIAIAKNSDNSKEI